MLAEQKEKEKTDLPRKNFTKNKAWSKQKNKKDRRKKMAAKRKHDEGSDVDDEDMKELLNDTRLLKKLKKGHISEEDFEKRITSKAKSKHKAASPGGTGGDDV
ncbi:ATP-dependent RNA helicase DDX55 [Nibea albiflora]|uniref:ATP-dependent RNA helicase DDX55 n=1 Tax=Nibea albiflora TaxID=240163 RepID=A0ACB7F8I2_NIBAL|nr:ATP-dependent RNA helicase DDX55 [Nibea albiflora]